MYKIIKSKSLARSYQEYLLHTRNNPVCVWRVSWSPYGQIPNCQIAENTSNHQEGISGQASGSAHGETSHNCRKLTYSRFNNIKKITCPRRILVECLSTQKKSGKNPNCKNILIHELILNQQSAYWYQQLQSAWRLKKQSEKKGLRQLEINLREHA